MKNEAKSMVLFALFEMDRVCNYDVIYRFWWYSRAQLNQPCETCTGWRELGMDSIIILSISPKLISSPKFLSSIPRFKDVLSLLSLLYAYSYIIEENLSTVLLFIQLRSSTLFHNSTCLMVGDTSKLCPPIKLLKVIINFLNRVCGNTPNFGELKILKVVNFSINELWRSN